MNTYIWQPFRYSPPFAYARVFITNLRTPHIIRLLVLYKSSKSLASFRALNEVERGSESGDARAPTDELIHKISIIYGVILAEMLTFLREVAEQLSNVVCVVIISSNVFILMEIHRNRLFEVEPIHEWRKLSI